jgi:hypothetical protein
VSDGTAALISAAVKAVVRNTFMKPSYKNSGPDTAFRCPQAFHRHPCADIDFDQKKMWPPRDEARRIAASEGAILA